MIHAIGSKIIPLLELIAVAHLLLQHFQVEENRSEEIQVEAEMEEYLPEVQVVAAYPIREDQG